VDHLNRYTIDSHAAIVIYLTTDPYSCYQVAKALGYPGKAPGDPLEEGEQSMNDWFVNIIFQCWLADQAGGKRSGAKDARIWLDHVFPSAPNLDTLAEELQMQVDEDRSV
jgi:hypothetical protein